MTTGNQVIIERMVKWLDDQNGCDQTEQGLRILKIAEELGEASQAWIGFTGQNPRKGVTHTQLDVTAELADVAVTALVAMQSLGGRAFDHLEARLDYLAERVGA